jgi:hypothetical protein
VIAVDSDVLGRDRPGDETYVANLLQALAGAKGDPRIGAITRDASLVPDGIEPLVLTTGSQELRMAWSVPRLLRRLSPRRRMEVALGLQLLFEVPDESFEFSERSGRLELLGRRDGQFGPLGPFVGEEDHGLSEIQGAEVGMDRG